MGVSALVLLASSSCAASVSSTETDAARAEGATVLTDAIDDTLRFDAADSVRGDARSEIDVHGVETGDGSETAPIDGSSTDTSVVMSDAQDRSDVTLDQASDVNNDVIVADSGRECETYNADGACALLYGTYGNDSGARYVCCAGRCRSGVRCLPQPGLGSCGIPLSNPDGCDLSAGELCCRRSSVGAPTLRCVARDTGRCRVYP